MKSAVIWPVQLPVSRGSESIVTKVIFLMAVFASIFCMIKDLLAVTNVNTKAFAAISSPGRSCSFHLETILNICCCKRGFM